MDLGGRCGPGLWWSFPCTGHFTTQILPCDWLGERPLGGLGGGISRQGADLACPDVSPILRTLERRGGAGKNRWDVVGCGVRSCPLPATKGLPPPLLPAGHRLPCCDCMSGDIEPRPLSASCSCPALQRSRELAWELKEVREQSGRCSNHVTHNEVSGSVSPSPNGSIWREDLEGSLWL